MYVLLLTTAIQSLVSMAALTVPVLAPKIAPDLGLPSATVGYYIALLYLAAMPVSVLGGDAVIRFGPIRVNQAGLMLCAVGLAMLSLGIPGLLPLGALLIGFGYGPITPASSHMLALSTSPKNLSLVFSIKQTGVPLGGVLAGLLAPPLEEALGWRGALLSVAVACTLCAAAAQRLRSSPDDARRTSHPLGLSMVGELARLLRDSPALRTLAASSFCFSTFQLSITTYLVTYLHEDFGYSLLAAGAAMSLAQAAGVVGRIVWGVAADRHLSAIAMLVVLACAMSVSALMLAAASSALPAAALLAIVCMAGATGLGWNGTFLAEVTRQAPPGLAGRATGAILSCTFAGVVVGPPLFGLVAQLTLSYRAAFGAVMVGPAIAAVLLYARRDSFSGRA